ncbi:MAG: PGF-pre-PGF domain-containing protein [Nanoarchaeota archaeon]|nr:PGF-pre-PGF domain-containing protein [Nanoarchaeota archaeon]MBU4124604.1 PGF-pre-PGF domain-containing protein [Nanoarchaeota archaeon]
MNKKYILLLGIIFSLIFVSSSVYAICWDNDGNQASCDADSNCQWFPSSSNSWCDNSVGCCDSKGCWMYDGNAAGCTDTINFGGVCQWIPKASDSYCPNDVGCCFAPFCEETLAQSQANCTNLTAMGMPCNWTDANACVNLGMNMFIDQDSCLASGGTWDGSSCSMPMFMGDAHCWFADNNPEVCTNTIGCGYCTNVGNDNETDIANITSLCYGASAGWCQGHEPNNAGGIFETDSLACDDIGIKTVCECGPLPNCDWNSTHCIQGFSTSCNLGAPPVPFCDAINPITNLPVNQTTCGNLNSVYMMPCKWENNKCVFSADNFFKGSTSGGDIGGIMSSSDCAMAGGTWKSEIYTDPWDGTIKSNSWCEMNFGSSFENCDGSCWACEYQPGGSAWASVAVAKTKCEASNAVPGGCQWNSNTYAMNGMGWCDFPSVGTGGGSGGFGDCNDNCFNCGGGKLMCEASAASCVWTTDPMGIGGWCDPAAMAQFSNCSLHCTACMGETNCNASTANNSYCFYNSTYNICQNGTNVNDDHAGYLAYEFCMIPGDEDGDELADCQDSDCSMSPMCGFGMGPGGGMGMMLPPGVAEGVCFVADNTNISYCEAIIINANMTNGTLNVDPWWVENNYINASYNHTHRAVNTTIIPEMMNNTQLCYYHPSPDGGNWCDPVMDQQMKGGMNMMGPPPMPLGIDSKDDTNYNETPQEWLDIVAVGIMNDPQMISIGIPIKNMTNFSACNKIWSADTTNETGKYYRYIDVDNNATTGCNAYYANGTAIGGFDYRLDLVANSTSVGYQVNTSAYRCLNSNWQTHSATLTYMKEGCSMSPPPNDPLFGGQTFVGTNMLMVQKKDIGNPTSNMRIFVSTANATGNWNVTVDDAGPYYYTPGSIDFKFECCDCPGQDMDGDGYTSDQDPDCKMFKKFGYVPFEDCFSPQDDDNDGLTNCADSDCKYDAYICGGSFNATFIASLNDKTAPSIVWLKAQTFPDSAFIIYDTNEPANGTLLFYNVSSTCSYLNNTIHDIGIIDNNTQQYKNWHDGPLDNFQYNPQKINHLLTNGTTYYYKLKTCDPSGNCAVSSCLNFTTPKTMSKANCPMCNFTMKFAYTPPTGLQQTDFLGNLSVKFDMDNDGVYDNETSGTATAMYMNYTDVKNVSIKFTNPSSAENWSIEFINADMTGALSKLSTITALDGSSDMIHNNSEIASGGNQTYMGLSASKWQVMKAMSPKFLNLSLQGNQSELWHCSDDLSTCVNKTNETIDHYYNTTTNMTVWKMPVTTSMFSVYGGARYIAPTITITPLATAPGGGGGGGGGGGASGMSYLYESSKEKVTVSIWTLKADKESYLNLDAMGLKQFNITVNKAFNDKSYAKLYITKLDALNISVPEGIVERYYNIEMVNVTEADIYKIKFKYTVNKSWMIENKVDESTIKMQRYTGSWKILPTTILSSDDKQTTFVSESSGLSYFAVTGLAAGAEYTETFEETVPEDLEPTYEEESVAVSPMIYGAVLFIIIAGIVYYFLSKKKGLSRKR